MADPVRTCKALADETRLRLVRLLLRGPLSVNEIIEVLGMGQSRVSRHLKILAEAELLDSRRQGTWIYYGAGLASADPMVVELLRLLERHERRLPCYGEDLQALETVIERRREKTRTFFDGLTDPHAVHRVPDGDVYRRAVLELLPEGCGVALDMGTGSGLLLPALLGRAVRVIAVDASRTMLAMARRTAGEQASRCEFRLGDLAHLPVADGEADTVAACMVLHHLSDPAAALGEAFRALRPGGLIAVVDLLQHDDESLRERLADLWLGFPPEEVAQWLAAAGFAVDDHGLVGEPGSLQLITFRGSRP